MSLSSFLNIALPVGFVVLIVLIIIRQKRRG